MDLCINGWRENQLVIKFTMQCSELMLLDTGLDDGSSSKLQGFFGASVLLIIVGDQWSRDNTQFWIGGLTYHKGYCQDQAQAVYHSCEPSARCPAEIFPVEDTVHNYSYKFDKCKFVWQQVQRNNSCKCSLMLWKGFVCCNNIRQTDGTYHGTVQQFWGGNFV